MEGSKVRRRAKSVSNAIRAPKSAHTLPKAPQSVFSTPRGRDVLLYPDKATFYNPACGDLEGLELREQAGRLDGLDVLREAEQQGLVPKAQSHPD